MDSEYFDEECLLKVIKISKLALKISKFNYSRNNFSEPIKKAYELLEMVRKLTVEISEFEHRMNSKLSEHQRNMIYDSIEDLEILVSHMENKISYKSSSHVVIPQN